MYKNFLMNFALFSVHKTLIYPYNHSLIFINNYKNCMHFKVIKRVYTNVYLIYRYLKECKKMKVEEKKQN